MYYDQLFSGILLTNSTCSTTHLQVGGVNSLHSTGTTPPPARCAPHTSRFIHYRYIIFLYCLKFCLISSYRLTPSQPTCVLAEVSTVIVDAGAAGPAPTWPPRCDWLSSPHTRVLINTNTLLYELFYLETAKYKHEFTLNISRYVQETTLVSPCDQTILSRDEDS